MRDKYDSTARAAQLEVQRIRSHTSANPADAQHFGKLVQELDPDELEQVASSLVNAAREARTKTEVRPAKPSQPEQKSGAPQVRVDGDILPYQHHVDAAPFSPVPIDTGRSPQPPPPAPAVCVDCLPSGRR